MNEETRRSALEAAYDKSGEEEVDDLGTGTEEEEPAAEENEDKETASGGEAAGAATSEELPGKSGEDEHGDDEGAGKVSDKAAEDAGKSKEEESGSDKQDQDSKYDIAPSGWKAAAREKWKDVPPDIKAEIHRREANIRDVLQETANQRKFAEDFNQMIRPFEPLLASQNADPLGATKSFFQTAAGLVLGTPTQKAQIVSNIIKEYGVDIGELDNVLSGQMAPNSEGNPDPALTRMLDERFAPIQNFMGEFAQMRQQYNANQQTTMEQELSQFAESHEFFEDVREDMADLLDLASSRKKTLSLEDAYERALQLHPDIIKIIQERKDAAALASVNEDLEKKAQASSSVSSDTPSSQEKQSPKTRRGALEAAFNEAEAG